MSFVPVSPLIHCIVSYFTETDQHIMHTAIYNHSDHRTDGSLLGMHLNAYVEHTGTF
jgi:hypothetical protein